MMSGLKFAISRYKNDVVATGQNKQLLIYYPPQAGKCPHSYHCQETLPMTKVTNCTYNVYRVGQIRAKFHCVF